MTPDEIALRKMIDAWIAATDAEDMEALSALVAPDAVFLAPARPPAEGREAWAATREPRPNGVLYRCDVQQVAAYGSAGHAWFHVELTIPAAEGEAEIRVEGHNLSLYRKDAAGKWWLTREARMLAPGKA